ncbi:TRAP transporter substrate-binding protein [Oceanobacillus polygoni]|uniref:TRAP transporter substrate-binding protein n=1 Tax=Oceanobacillus polygoni TaxID=1235259 RepID=UPI0011F34C34|nr:TRAP transporter substrate-binding protein [Oceanobacillus polygoni]
MVKKSVITLFTLLLLFILAGCQAAAEKSGAMELKLAHNQTLDHPVHISLVEFGRLVEEKSNGDIKIRIYPNAQLGSEREVTELTQTGAVDLAKVSASALEAFESDYSIFSLPYVFEDYDMFEKVMNNENVTDKLYNQTEGMGFIGLTYYNAGERHLYTKNREVNDIPDMKGLKVRVQPSQTSVQMIEALGGIPTAMAYGEVYTAIQSGVIDAAENNETALVGNNHGEVAKYYMYTGHQIVPDMFIMNANRFNQLSEEHQEIIKEAAKESTVFHEDVWAKTVQEQTETAKNEMGVNFIDVDKSPFIEAVQPLHENYSNNENTAEIYQLIQEAKKDE